MIKLSSNKPTSLQGYGFTEIIKPYDHRTPRLHAFHQTSFFIACALCFMALLRCSLWPLGPWRHTRSSRCVTPLRDARWAFGCRTVVCRFGRAVATGFVFGFCGARCHARLPPAAGAAPRIQSLASRGLSLTCCHASYAASCLSLRTTFVRRTVQRSTA